MDKDERARLRALCNAATPGPWVMEREELSTEDFEEEEQDTSFPRSIGPIAYWESVGESDPDQVEADAEFIAATDPSTVMRLLDALFDASAEIDRLTHMAMKWTDAMAPLSGLLGQREGETLEDAGLRLVRGHEQERADLQRQIEELTRQRATALPDARKVYFDAGGIESDVGPRDDPAWYWRRAMKLYRAKAERFERQRDESERADLARDRIDREREAKIEELERQRDAEHGRALDLREVEELLQCGEGEAPREIRQMVLGTKFHAEATQRALQAVIAIGGKGARLLDLIMSRALPDEHRDPNPDRIACAEVTLRRILQERDAEKALIASLEEDVARAVVAYASLRGEYDDFLSNMVGAEEELRKEYAKTAAMQKQALTSLECSLRIPLEPEAGPEDIALGMANARELKVWLEHRESCRINGPDRYNLVAKLMTPRLIAAGLIKSGDIETPTPLGQRLLTLLQASDGEKAIDQILAPANPVVRFDDAPRRECNRHNDCEAAETMAREQGRPAPDHCHDECCEECFGS